MTSNEFRQELEKNIAALTAKREQSAQEEALAEKQLLNCKSQTAFVSGRLTEAQSLLNKFLSVNATPTP